MTLSHNFKKLGPTPFWAGGQIWDEVAGIEDPALQLRTALSDLFPEEKDLLTVVGRTFPDREPQDVLDDWADTVSKLS